MHINNNFLLIRNKNASRKKFILVLKKNISKYTILEISNNKINNKLSKSFTFSQKILQRKSV